MGQNWLPDFIEKLPTIKFIDRLGALLTGNSDPEPVEYHFKDVVKQSGHACPTIAGAYGIVYEAMESLYPNGEIPVRGEIRVDCPETQTSGSMGPLSQAISYLTGACAENGFNGLAGRFQRSGLLRFTGEPSGTPFRFTRVDTNKSVEVYYHSNKIPGDPAMGMLMQKVISGSATVNEQKAFGMMFQNRVRYVLESKENRRELFEVIEL